MPKRSFAFPCLAPVLLLVGCFEAHREPRTLTVDGSVPPDDALTASAPSRCFPSGADTVLIGPEPGCIETTVPGIGDGLDSHPASGTPLRFVDMTGAELDVLLTIEERCPDRSIYMVTWLQEHCDHGQFVQGECSPEIPEPPHAVAFDELAEDGLLEALVGGEGVAIHFRACAVRR